MRKWSLLFITDIHYESPDSNFEDDPKETDVPAYRATLTGAFHQLLEHGFGRQKFDLAALGGDFTTHGKSAGFQRFVSEALPKLTKLVHEDRAIAAVPGNHDVTWGLDVFETGAFDKKFHDMWRFVQDSGVTSCLFPEGSLTAGQDDRISFKRPAHGPLYCHQDRKVLALCVNSAIRCGEFNTKISRGLQEAIDRTLQPTSLPGKDKLLADLKQAFQKHAIRDVAHVTAAQRGELLNCLVEAQREIGNEWTDYLKIAILHHPLLPFPNQVVEHRGYESLLDAGDILSFLVEFGFDAVFTGHKHQSFWQKHSQDGREILLLGGPTVGGYRSGNSGSGFYCLDVEDRGEERHFRVTSISTDQAHGNPRDAVAQARKLATAIPLRPLSPAAFRERLQKAAGYSYREFACMTLINDDGDARKIVQCEDLKTEEGSDRANFHEVWLPPTSGVLSALSAGGKDFEIDIETPIPPDAKDHSTRLRFNQALGVSEPADYSYQWWAINAFALDRLWFAYKYNKNPAQKGVEFTFYVTEDPVGDLTIIVQFPPGRAPAEARIRVARIDREQKDSRKWTIDRAAQSELRDAQALRYFKPLNIASLRVRNPKRELSYGIEWDVPVVSKPRESAFAQELRRRLAAGISSEGMKAMLIIMARLFATVREALPPDWRGALDASLMYFDGESKLSLLVAAETLPDGSVRELTYRAAFGYGEGVAGRALKANQPRVWSAAGKSLVTEEPQYYVTLPGCPKHQVLVSLPVHLPVEEPRWQENPKIYENSAPYAVLSMGSNRADCPLARLDLPRFQHLANVDIHRGLIGVLDGHPPPGGPIDGISGKD